MCRAHTADRARWDGRFEKATELTTDILNRSAPDDAVLTAVLAAVHAVDAAS